VKQVMRLNSVVYCDGCGSSVNPYVLERKPEESKLECPNCSHVWDEKMHNFDDAA
jgi:uncharacterized Zn finger protein